MGFSQQAKILRGKIVGDAIQSKSINIINLTKSIGTINDAVSFFEIPASIGDTIVFSSVQHQKHIHIVTNDNLKEADLSIQLVVKVNELDEVIVKDHDLSGTVKDDIKNIKTYEDNLPIYNAKSLDETPFVHEKGVTTIRNTTVDHRKNATEFDFIATRRMIASLFKKKNKGKSKEISIPEVSDFYNGDFLITELKIPETEIYNFFDYLNTQTDIKDVLKSGDELRILEYLITQGKTFNTTILKE